MLLLGRTQMLPQFSIPDSAAFLMNSGFDGVEISPFDKKFRPREEFFAPDFALKMCEAMEKAGVRGYAVSAHMDFSFSKENFALVRRTLEIAHALGAKYLVTSPAHKYKDEDPFTRWARNIRASREMCRIAESLGMRLALEFEPEFLINNTEKLLMSFAEIDSPALGINADIGHMFLCDADPMQALAESAPYILHAHVENMARGVHNHLVPWEGNMDLGAYLTRLREVGFDGMMGLDLYAYEYADVCAQSAQFIRNLL